MSRIAIPPIGDIIAHRGTMLLIDDITTVDTSSCCARSTPDRNAWYIDENGSMPAWFGIELMAQTIAAWVHLNRPQGQLPKQGVLLGARTYTAHTSSFASGEPLLIRATVIYRDESGLGAFDCEIVREMEPENPIATSTLKVFEPEDFHEFLKEKSV